MSGLETHYLVLINMVIQVITMSHLIGCFWHKIQDIEIENGEVQTWLQVNNFQDQEWYTRYIQSYYWATATIMLIGTTGKTNYECTYSNFILFFTVGIFAYILENIKQTINSLAQDTMEYKSNLQTINKYMKNNNLDQDTQVLVRQQLEYCYKSSQEINTNKEATKVLKQLPDNLSTTIKNQINGSIIKKYTPLTRNFSKQTIKLSCQNQELIQETAYVSQELIFQQNQPQDIFMYLVLGGEVELYYSKDKSKDDKYHSVHVIKKIKSGELFGIESFFSGQVPRYSARCTQFTNICSINRTEFIRMLKYNQLEYEKFCLIKDEYCELGITKFYNRPCILCNENIHNEDYCNLLFYNPKRYQLQLKEKFLNTFKQVRQRFYRDSDFVQIKKTNPKVFLETNILLNNHFNYKYPDLAISNSFLYKNYIQQITQTEYISETDSEYDDSDYTDTSESSKDSSIQKGTQYKTAKTTYTQVKKSYIKKPILKNFKNFIMNLKKQQDEEDEQDRLSKIQQMQQTTSHNSSFNNGQNTTANIIMNDLKLNQISNISIDNKLRQNSQQLIGQTLQGAKCAQSQNTIQNPSNTKDLDSRHYYHQNTDSQYEQMEQELNNLGNQVNQSFHSLNQSFHVINQSQLRSAQQGGGNIFVQIQKNLSDQLTREFNQTNDNIKKTYRQLESMQLHFLGQLQIQQASFQHQFEKQQTYSNQFSNLGNNKLQQQKVLFSQKSFKKTPSNLGLNNSMDQPNNLNSQIQGKRVQYQDQAILKDNQNLYDNFILIFDKQQEFEIYYIKHNLQYILKKYYDKFQAILQNKNKLLTGASPNQTKKKRMSIMQKQNFKFNMQRPSFRDSDKNKEYKQSKSKKLTMMTNGESQHSYNSNQNISNSNNNIIYEKDEKTLSIIGQDSILQKKKDRKSQIQQKSYYTQKKTEDQQISHRSE